jgi:hypothetical protein
VTPKKSTGTSRPANDQRWFLDRWFAFLPPPQPYSFVVMPRHLEQTAHLEASPACVQTQKRRTSLLPARDRRRLGATHSRPARIGADPFVR